MLTAPNSLPSISALTEGFDQQLYALDSFNRVVDVTNGSSPTQWNAAGSSFQFTVSQFPMAFAMGPDGRAYAVNGSDNIQALAANGVTQTGSLTPPASTAPAGNAIVAGRNGYVYANALINTDSTVVVERISY